MIVITDKELEIIRKLIADRGPNPGLNTTLEEVEDLEKSLSVAYPENIGEPEV